MDSEVVPETVAFPAGSAGHPALCRTSPVIAALDLGTNNCRLLIARPARDGFRVIDAFSRIVRLGEGVSASGRLSDAAMARTVAALRICEAKMRRRGVTLSRAVATEACRRAGNVDSFRDRVREEAGLKLEVISTQEEARLALAGCAPLLDRAVPRAIVFDIGGGSTELLWVELVRGRPRSIDQISIPHGVVSLTERHGGDGGRPADYPAMVRTIATALEAFDRRNGIGDQIALRRVQLLGTSGTVTTLAGIRLGLCRYDRSKVDGTWLPRDEALDLGRRVGAMDFDERSGHPCIGAERADLVVAGCAVLDAIWSRWPVPRLRIADRGVREGILWELSDRARSGG